MRRMPPAPVILPKFADWIFVFGLPQFTVLNALNNSARTWNCVRPASLKFFASDKSVTSECGPRSRLRGALPYVNCAGNANAEASKQLMRPRPAGFGWQFNL